MCGELFSFLLFNCSAKWELVYVVRYIEWAVLVGLFYFKYMHACC